MSDVVALAKAAVEGVTEGPWSLVYESCDCGNGYGCGHPDWPYAIQGPKNLEAESYSDDYVARYGLQVTEVAALSDTDAKFIAASRSLVPELVAEIERLRSGVGV